MSHDYPEECPICGRDVLAEHESGEFEEEAFRVCDAPTGDRHQWREDGKVWVPRKEEWMPPEEVDMLWDMQTPDEVDAWVFDSAE